MKLNTIIAKMQFAINAINALIVHICISYSTLTLLHFAVSNKGIHMYPDDPSTTPYEANEALLAYWNEEPLLTHDQLATAPPG